MSEEVDDYYCVFNSKEYDVTKARNIIKQQLGDAAWRDVLARKRSGVMEVFRHQPTDATKLFVAAVADSVRKRHGWMAPSKKSPLQGRGE